MMLGVILAVIIGLIVIRVLLGIGGKIAEDLRWEDRLRKHAEASRRFLAEHNDDGA